MRIVCWFDCKYHATDHRIERHSIVKRCVYLVQHTDGCWIVKNTAKIIANAVRAVRRLIIVTAIERFPGGSRISRPASSGSALMSCNSAVPPPNSFLKRVLKTHSLAKTFNSRSRPSRLSWLIADLNFPIAAMRSSRSVSMLLIGLLHFHFGFGPEIDGANIVAFANEALYPLFQYI